MEKYEIVNRNDDVKKLDVNEIRKAINWASQNLNVNSVELESQVESIYKNMISTEDIQKSLIDLAVRLTTLENPEWRFVAARLLIMDTYKKAAKTRNYSKFGYGDYVTFVRSACEKNLYDPEILNKYSEDEIKQAGSFIKPEYDLDYDYAGANMVVTRYLIMDRDDVFELPQEALMTISLWLSVNEDKDIRMSIVKKFYDILGQRKLSVATPILLNLRKVNGNLSSCFVTAIDDDLNSIFDNVTKIAKISKNGGGVGVNISRVRAQGAEIKQTPNASGGIVPWIKIIDDTANAVNQLGKRAGAVTVALDIWHLDIEDFLELQTETGDLRRKAYDIFPQIVVSDLFMERVEKNEKWTLFDPNEIKIKYNVEIAELWGDEFKEFYEKIENEDVLELKKVVLAKEVLITIMKTQVETGMPYIFFKDTVNKMNPNKHDGFVGSGNLCQESFSNFRPSTIENSFIDENGDVVSKSKNGLVHTCNLVSVNLSNIETKLELEEICSMGVRILDNTIELTKTPIEESDIHNNTYRTIGVGAMGLADYLANKDIRYVDSGDIVDELFEDFSYFVTKASNELAIKRGSYKLYNGSDWSKGILFGKDKSWFNENSNNFWRWSELIDSIKEHGIRNGQLLAIAPNTSSSLVQGCSASVLPIFSKFYVDKNTKGSVPVCPPFIKDKFWFYLENKNIDQRKVVNIISRIQKWVDQGISMEVLYNMNNNIEAKDIYETIMTAWKQGCKTIYYTRTIQKNSNIASSKEECVSCAN